LINKMTRNIYPQWTLDRIESEIKEAIDGCPWHRCRLLGMDIDYHDLSYTAEISIGGIYLPCHEKFFIESYKTFVELRADIENRISKQLGRGDWATFEFTWP